MRLYINFIFMCRLSFYTGIFKPTVSKGHGIKFCRGYLSLYLACTNIEIWSVQTKQTRYKINILSLSHLTSSTIQGDKENYMFCSADIWLLPWISWGKHKYCDSLCHRKVCVLHSTFVAWNVKVLCVLCTYRTNLKVY